MQPGFDKVFQLAEEVVPLGVTFSLPQSGWVRVAVTPLLQDRQIRCSEVFDPMPGMIRWLEAVATGRDCACWSINEEGCRSYLNFLGTCSPKDDLNHFLLHCWTGIDGQLRIRGIRVERLQLVESFYNSFCAMTEDPSYSPHEWDLHPDHARFDEMNEEEWEQAYNEQPYSGTPLRTLRSAVVERYLAKHKQGD